MEYRAFVFLEDVYQAVRVDVAFLAGLLPASSYKAVSPPSSGPVNFRYQEGDTDAYGDVLTAGKNYRVLVMLVPRETDKVSSALVLPAVHVRWAPPASPPAPEPAPGPPGQASPPGGGPARTTTPAGKQAPEGADPAAGQTPSGAGAK
jgi:hypothetical protein